MKELSFGDGRVTYNINGRCTVDINPTDSFFVERLYKVFEKLDKEQDGYKAQVQKMADKKEIFEFCHEKDAEMREMINSIFEKPVCDAVFCNMSVYSIADGLPVWANFILAIMDECDTTFAREQKATNPRIQKYTAKYQRK